jgi:protocatechuate 3,4-dioxygenase beta subunit
MTRLGRVVLVCLLLFPAMLAIAQSPLTSLRGTIVDTTGAMVPGAQITLDQSQTGLHLIQTSDGKGEYQFQQLPPGIYTITLTATG